MELSGLIFVALALVWAVVLIPKALKHHDDLAETGSVDTVSDRVRVLARREAVSARSSRLVVTSVEPTPLPSARSVRARARHFAAAAAARRRRRVLLALLVIAAGIGGASVAGYVATWAPAVPAALVAAFLAVARVTVRREHAGWEAHVVARRGTPEAPAPEAEAVAPEPDVVDDAVVPARPDTDEAADVVGGLDATQSIRVGSLRDVEPTTDSGSLWDPLPVTLPTYVGKPRATRSVRTIDLSAPDVASAGRDAAASALVAEAATAAGPDEPGQRAVGS